MERFGDQHAQEHPGKRLRGCAHGAGHYAITSSEAAAGLLPSSTCGILVGIEAGTSIEVKRRLAAIVFADIVGYTDRSHRNEQLTLDLRHRVETIVRQQGSIRNGQFIKSLGDGFLLEFHSAVEAVSYAIELQEQIRFDVTLSEQNPPVTLRVGVHVGDVVEENGDVLGNAVNVASRVHSMAKPGGICMTREVYAHIRPILRLRCKPVPIMETDRVPKSVEVLEISELEGQTSVSLLAVKRPKRPWLVPVLAGACIVLALLCIVLLTAWLQSR